MTSLFDIAAELSQYNDNEASEAKVPAIHPQSALGILDETFETIYGARQYRLERKHLPLVRSTSMVQLQATRLAESKSAEVLDARLNRLASFRSPSTTAPRRMNPAIAVAGLIIPPPPSMPPPPDNSRKASNIDKDPDIAAKAVLRDVTNEIDQLVATSTSSVEEDEALLRMLSDKYIHARLSKLPGTPFVQLVRKKVTQKFDQLELRLRSRRTSSDPASMEDTGKQRSSDNDNNSGTNPAIPLDGVATWKALQRLTPEQHKMLQNLLQLPEEHLVRLPKAQLELVQFAKRYEKLVKATPDQLRHLPIEHQHLVRSVQIQQKQLTRVDDRR
ncbi:hypothetical protein PF002_g8035 [Phytophthora fragariae]|nr:hypothetical protein PF009_g7884 [Phytophthora fragariae]KAE9019821.1 hypothetical protein PF011_g5654 [Phytophthora fragariae]KAE9151748.1 hypothetical protein PF006_g3962 [Phytophthora fragariae]KAE9243877.1 hypothetical protein PF002_g8035 [Phytophthora fragariae]